jgi:toxin ParE1/3/4
LAAIFTTSLEQWGIEAHDRYRATIDAAVRKIAADPQGVLTRDCGAAFPGIRSMHLRHIRGEGLTRNPAHIVYFRVVSPELVEIVGILHERMEPTRRFGSARHRE